MIHYTCRICQTELHDVFIDLGSSPLSNAYLSDLGASETWYPLCVYKCDECGLVQLPAHETPQKIFGEEYLYFSSYSTSWVEHARQYAEMMISRFELDSQSLVVELASNDGYLLQHFKGLGIPVLGVEPAPNVAQVAERRGISTMVEFFGRDLAENLKTFHAGEADVIHGANVLAHVPDLDDFVGGMKVLLAPRGVITMEFPHLMRLIQHAQFDTIYHEHYSYFSLKTTCDIFKRCGLYVFDVEELSTHGGSIRIFARHAGDNTCTDRVIDLLEREKIAESDSMRELFQQRVRSIKNNFIEYLINCSRRGISVAGFGAPAKANTLLNYCGVRPDLLPYVVDDNPHKVGRYMPGSRIPILTVRTIFEGTKPDEVLVMPWNLYDSIRQKLLDGGFKGKITSPVDLTKT